MSGSYPLAYRRTAPDPWRRGFQQPPRGPIVPPLPANDPFWPANDNPRRRGRAVRPFHRTVRYAPFGKKGLGFAGGMIRDHPLFRIWRYTDLILRYQGEPQIIGAGSAYGGSEWYKYSTCPGTPPPTHIYFGGVATRPIYCLKGQAKTEYMHEIGTPIPRYWYNFSLYWDNGRATHPMEHESSWKRDKLPRAGAPDEPAVTLAPNGFSFPDVAPSLQLSVDPLSVPLHIPAPDPAPVPYPLIPLQIPNPFYSPFERTVRGPVAVRAPSVAASPRFTFQPGRNPRVESNPPPHVRKPPPKGTKERKVAIAVGGIPAKIISAVTETADVISAIFKALPGNIKAKYGRKPQDKARAIYDHYDKVDIPRALANLLAQQVSDRAWGHIGKRSGEAARRAGKSTGFQLGPWDTAFSDFGNMIP